jgi:uncharacterized protein YprB with RNaseH-like and TPR domain
MSESRRKKLQMLTRSIARGDFASAAKLLQAEALSAHGGGTHKGAQDGGTDKRGDDGGKASIDKRGDDGGRASIDKRREDAGKAKIDSRVGPVALVEACPGVEAMIKAASGEARCWLIRRRLSDVSPDCLEVARQYAAVLRGARQRFDELEASAELCRAADARPEDLLFLDIETCGFSGTSIFLVGTMSFADGEFLFEQHFARNYAEEAAILRAFTDRYARTGLLVSFNGKAFDMNMIRERAAFHAVEMPEEQPSHLDLLHESRRRWRGRVPNCRLQTLERHFCGRVRAGDIPGAAIPDAYHRFVDTGDAREVRDIIHHNLLDLLTMAQLLCAVLTGCEPSGE